MSESARGVGGGGLDIVQGSVRGVTYIVELRRQMRVTTSGWYMVHQVERRAQGDQMRDHAGIVLSLNTTDVIVSFILQVGHSPKRELQECAIPALLLHK